MFMDQNPFMNMILTFTTAELMDGLEDTGDFCHVIHTKVMLEEDLLNNVLQLIYKVFINN